jgi:hypothetical protein
MAGALTKFLQREFGRQLPLGWTCRREASVLSPPVERLLGYSPRADVLLEHQDTSQKVWVEFEVSRADPVANHAKFATSHLFEAQGEDDVFVAMVSPHVARGRRNLASSTIVLMRRIGMNAFQTVLFPTFSAEAIKHLNHSNPNALETCGLNVQREVHRVFEVSQPVFNHRGRRIHFAGDPFEVMVNARRWNIDMGNSELRRLWGRRTITYFVFSPSGEEFAPSKFCAYVPIGKATETADDTSGFSAMTVGLYVTLDGTDTRFDGHRARTHLEDGLGFVPVTLGQDSFMEVSFSKWLDRLRDSVTLHPDGPIVLRPPRWFT